MRARSPITEPTVIPATAPFETPISSATITLDTTAAAVETAVVGELAIGVEGATVDKVTGPKEESVCPGRSAIDPVVMRFLYDKVCNVESASQYRIN
jgi:hypothetical protein